MKLSEGLKLKMGRGVRIKIPDCSRNDLPELFKERGYKVGAEIGVCKGVFSEILCKGGFKMYGIDPWIMAPDYQHPRGQSRLDQQYEETKARLARFDYTIIRKTSMEAVKDFEDGSLDFVYIDANHHFRYIAEDIVEWTKKVRSGGIVSGHDFWYSRKTGENAIHVRWVVEAYVGAYDIKPLFQLGHTKGKDKWPSWMFIKE